MLNKVEVLNNIKLLTQEDNEPLLNLLINKAEKTIISFCNITEVTEEMQDILEDLICYRYNLIGREGLKSEGMGSASISFTDGIPAEIKTRLYRYRRLRVL